MKKILTSCTHGMIDWTTALLKNAQKIVMSLFTYAVSLSVVRDPIAVHIHVSIATRTAVALFFIIFLSLSLSFSLSLLICPAQMPCCWYLHALQREQILFTFMGLLNWLADINNVIKVKWIAFVKFRNIIYAEWRFSIYVYIYMSHLYLVIKVLISQI